MYRVRFRLPCPVKDKMKDNFLNSIGIKVYREKDFQSNMKVKLDNLVQFIKSLPKCKFSVDY